MSSGPPNVPPPPPPTSVAQAGSGGSEFALNFGTIKNPIGTASTSAPPPAIPPKGVSAPTSPAKSRESLLQRVQSLTGAARDQGASILGIFL